MAGNALAIWGIFPLHRNFAKGNKRPSDDDRRKSAHIEDLALPAKHFGIDQSRTKSSYLGVVVLDAVQDPEGCQLLFGLDRLLL